MAKELTPIAFMSYVRFDDQHENGRLTEFRNRLSGEVRMQTGEEFSIFQDRNDIKWGQNWKERIEDSIDAATFLIPIITPNFFNSTACRGELEQFLEREKELERNDLILPVYYVGSTLLDNELKRAGDKLAEEIGARQFADWRELRFEPFTSPQVSKTIAKLAVQIRDSLESLISSKKPASKQTHQKMRSRPAKTGSTQSPRSVNEQSLASRKTIDADQAGAATQVSSAKTEPPTRVVDPLLRGDHSTITEAIEKANPGDRILVRPGLYKEGLVIDKPLEIIGDGAIGDVLIQAIEKNALLFKTTMGRVVNLTFQQIGGGELYCINIAQGRLELEECDISSQSLACIAIHGGADPRLRRNRIHDGRESGVYIYENSQGTLEDNDIFGNAKSGVVIKEGSNPMLRRNRIHDGKQTGVHVYGNGQGTLEDNDIFDNANVGVIIRGGSNPMLRRNRIYKMKKSGVYIYENGQGTLEDNDIFDNATVGIEIKTGGSPIVRSNRINKNGYEAIWVYEGGAGTIEDNDLRDNPKGAWDVSADSEPNLKRARNQQS